MYSGNRQGMIMERLSEQDRHKTFTKNIAGTAYKYDIEIVNIWNTLACDKVFKRIRDIQCNTTIRLYIISAGGDGTFNHVINMCVKNQVHIFVNDHHIGQTGNAIDKSVPIFSCIPLGTGNDLSQSVGWDRYLDKKDLVTWEDILTLSIKRVNGNNQPMDIWKVHLETYDVDEGYVRSRHGESQTTLDGYLCNYMSIGLQGEVGYNFEKHRTHTRFWNIVQYIRQSWRMIRQWRILRVKDYFDYLCTPLGTCKVSQENGNDVDLVIQNINGIWGRNINLWQECKYTIPTHKMWTPYSTSAQQEDNNVISKTTSVCDKRLEMFSITSRLDYFLKQFKFIRRLGKLNRYGQFNEINLHMLQSCKEMHCMIDGECYRVASPKVLQIRHSGTILMSRK